LARVAFNDGFPEDDCSSFLLPLVGEDVGLDLGLAVGEFLGDLEGERRWPLAGAVPSAFFCSLDFAVALLGTVPAAFFFAPAVLDGLRVELLLISFSATTQLCFYCYRFDMAAFYRTQEIVLAITTEKESKEGGRERKGEETQPQ